MTMKCITFSFHSLQGLIGPRGERGRDGMPGEAGIRGNDGVPGVAGPPVTHFSLPLLDIKFNIFTFLM